MKETQKKVKEKIEKVISEIDLYLVEYEDVHEHAIPSVKGLAKILDAKGLCARRTLYHWMSLKDEEGKEKYPDLVDAMHRIGDDQELALLHGGLTNKLNSNIVKLALGKHGYSDKQQQEISGTNGAPIQQAITVSFIDGDAG